MKQKRKRKSKRNKPTDGPEIYQEAVYDYYERQSAGEQTTQNCIMTLVDPIYKTLPLITILSTV